MPGELKEIKDAIDALGQGIGTQVAELKSKADSHDKALEKVQSDFQKKVDGLETELKSAKEELKARALAAEPKRKQEKFSIHEIAFFQRFGPKFVEENFPQSDHYQALVKTMMECRDRKALMIAQAKSAWGAKAQDLWSDPLGGLAVPFEVIQGEFIDLLRARSVAVQAGARLITGLTGAPVGINRQALGATAQWLTLGEKMSITSFKLDQIVAMPHRVGAAIELQENTNQLSSPELAQLGSDDLVEQLDRAIDKAVLIGQGADKEPLGIFVDPEITALTTGTLDYDKLLAFKKKLMQNNAFFGSLAWAGGVGVLIEILKLKASGVPLFPQDNFTSQSGQVQTDKVFRMPFYETTHLSDTSGSAQLVLANWADALIPMWQGLMISTSREAEDGFLKGTFVVKCEALMDVKFRHKESFVVAKDINVT